MKKIVFLLCFVGLFLSTPTIIYSQIKIKCNLSELKELMICEVSGESMDGETVIFDPKLMSLGTPSEQITSEEAIKAFKGETLNVYILKYLKDNQSLIPEEWKKYKVVFPGVKFLDSGNNEFVLYLYYWEGGGWDTSCSYSKEKFDKNTRIAKR